LHDVLPMWCTRLSWWNGTVRGVASMSSNLPPWNISTGLTIVGFTPPVVTAPRPSTRPSTTISTTSQSPQQGRNDPSLQDHRGGSLIDRDTFDRARQIATARHDAHTQRAMTQSDYHLTGLITCPDCGHKIHRHLRQRPHSHL